MLRNLWRPSCIHFKQTLQAAKGRRKNPRAHAGGWISTYETIRKTTEKFRNIFKYTTTANRYSHLTIGGRGQWIEIFGDKEFWRLHLSCRVINRDDYGHHWMRCLTPTVQTSTAEYGDISVGQDPVRGQWVSHAQDFLNVIKADSIYWKK